MDLKLSPEEAALQTGLREWLAAHYDFAAVRARSGRAVSRDPALWDGLVRGGWIARALPRRGEPQQSAVDAALVAEEFGRALVTEPFFRSAYLAACLLMEALPAETADPLLDDIAKGRGRFACALYEPNGRYRLRPAETRATQEGAAWRLTGRKAMVMDGADADRLLVTAATAEGTGLFLVEAGAEGLTRAGFHTIDDAATADVAVDRTPARLLATGEALAGALEAAVDRAITVVGAEAVGAADAALQETAAYTGHREQFGRPLARFQVVSHRLARMFVELESLRGGVLEALANAGGPASARAQAGAGLKVLLGESGRFVVNNAVQLHGGNGTLVDYKVSHCFKRVFALEVLYGDADFHLDRYERAMA